MGSGPKIKCLQCGDIIQSMHRHDLKYCKGNHVAVDGGSHYLKMLGDYEQTRRVGEGETEE